MRAGGWQRREDRRKDVMRDAEGGKGGKVQRCEPIFLGKVRFLLSISPTTYRMHIITVDYKEVPT
jgi:hypothetical protein